MNQGRFRWRRWWPWPAGIAALLLAYTLVGFYLVPHIARTQLDRFVHEQLHRQVEVGAIAFNPFTLIARIDRLDLREADGKPILHFDGLQVDAEFRSLWNKAIVLHEIRLDGPAVTVVIDSDGSINLVKLLPPPPPEAKPRAASKPIPIRIDVLSLNGGRIDFTDRSRPSPYSATLQSLQLSLTDFSSDAGHVNPVRFSAATSNNEQLGLNGDFTLAPLAARGKIDISGFRLATVTTWLQDRMPLDLSSGSLDLALQYDFTMGQPLQLKLTLPTVKLSDLALAPKTSPATSPWIRIPSVQVADTTVSLADRSVAVGSVEIAGGSVKAWRDADGAINLQHLLSSSPPAKPAATPVPAAKASPWQVKVGPVRLKEAAVDFEDRAVSPAVGFRVAPVDVSVKGVSTDPAAVLSIVTDLAINQKAHLHADTDLRLQPLAAAVKFELKDFELPPLQPYIAQTTAMTLLSGSVSSKAALDYSSHPEPGRPQLRFAGDVEVNNLATQDNSFHQDFVKWQTLQVAGLDFRKGPDSLVIERIEATKPYGRVIIGPDQTLNVTHILHPGQTVTATDAKPAATPAATAPAAASKPKATTAPMPIRIDAIVIHDGSANFADRSVQPSFATGIQKLNGDVKGLSSDPASRADVNLAGQVDRYSPVSIKGQINPLASSAYTDLALSFRNMELTTFNPYSGKFAGYNIAKGKLTTELHYHIENRKLDAQHHIIVDQLEFGPATDSKQAVSLPIKLAVALLKDRNGVIDLDLPVSGSLDDPAFRVMPIVWKVLVNTLTKAVMAPFSLLGSLFGGGPELQFVDFAPGSAELKPEQADRLQKLAHSLAERPQLKLDIPLTATTDADAVPLAHAALDKAVNTQSPPKAGASTDALQQQRVEALSALYLQQFGHRPEFPAVSGSSTDVRKAHENWLEQALLPGYRPNANRLVFLGRRRAEAVQGAILGANAIAGERIFLTSAPQPAETQKDAPPDAVRLELKLE